MKHIKLLFSISAIIWAMGSVEAQSIHYNARFLFVVVSWTSPIPYIIIDTSLVSYASSDTIAFHVKRDNFLKLGKLIYLIKGADSTLMYDYGLLEGDTFRFKYFTEAEDRLVVDSIRMVPLENGVSYKHWYLHSLEQKYYPYLTWVENYGEKTNGWNYDGYYGLHRPFVAAICKDTQELIYWNFYSMWPKPQKTCEFDLLRKALFIQKDVKEKIVLYPNPAGDYISLNGNESFEYRILDVMGRVVLSGVTNERILLSCILPGLYFISIDTGNGVHTQKFIKQ